jgi:hypothetical protein
MRTRCALAYRPTTGHTSIATTNLGEMLVYRASDLLWTNAVPSAGGGATPPFQHGAFGTSAPSAASSSLEGYCGTPAQPPEVLQPPQSTRSNRIKFNDADTARSRTSRAARPRDTCMMTVVADSRFYESNANLASAILYSRSPTAGGQPSPSPPMACPLPADGLPPPRPRSLKARHRRHLTIGSALRLGTRSSWCQVQIIRARGDSEMDVARAGGASWWTELVD